MTTRWAHTSPPPQQPNGDGLGHRRARLLKAQASRLLVGVLTPHIPTHNPCLLALHERLVETELDQLGQALVGAKVRTGIMRVRHRGEPRLEDIAARLHLTDRTLQRRLQAEAVSYQQLLDDTRRELARQYLGDVHRSLAEVADLMGFAVQSNLFRACKRWFGMPPGQYRARECSRPSQRLRPEAPQDPWPCNPGGIGGARQSPP